MRKTWMLMAALPLVLTSNAVSAQITVDRSSSARAERGDLRAPDIAVWIDRFSYRPGQRIRPFFQSDDGAFVTIIRVSTTGDLTVLYPHRPSQQVAYRTDALRDDEVPYWNDLPFFVNEAEGVGFVVAIASYEPFDYRRVSNRDRWDTWQLSSGKYRTTYGLNAYPDPYELVGSFIDRTLPASAEYSTDYIQYQVVRDYLYQRRYSNYNDLYYNCLSIYYGHADYYCSQYATYGYPIYVPVFIGRYPAPQGPPNSGKPAPDENRPKLRNRTIGDPVVDGGIENGPKAAQRSPTSAEVARADAQRTWWNAQRRENSGRNRIVDRPRIDPQATTVPQVYRSSPSQPRVESAPSRRSEPRVEYEPMRSEPMRSEPVRHAEPQREHVPVMRSEPAPQGKYERPVQSAPVQSAPVIRSEIPRVEARPAPPPPTQVHSEPVQSKPVVPPPAPPVKDQ